MIILGIEIRRAPKEKSALELLKEACDNMNYAWLVAQNEGEKARPWIIWEERRVVISKYNGRPEILHE